MPNNPRGLWRRTTLDSFRTTQPQWDVILDLERAGDGRDEDWIWGGAATLAARAQARTAATVARAAATRSCCANST